MQPLNRAERRKAFINFLLLFVVTITLIVTAIFFSIQVPFSQYESLQAEKNEWQQEREQAQAFHMEMTGALQLLKPLNTGEAEPENVKRELDRRLNNMYSLVSTQDSADNWFYLPVMENLDALRNAQKQIRELKSREKNTAALDAKITELNDIIRQKDKDIFECQQRHLAPVQ